MLYDIIFISTCCDHQHIYKLIHSVIENNSVLNVCLIIVNQEKVKIEDPFSNIQTDIHIIEHGKIVNTSIARNIGIQHVIDSGMKCNFVGFPDDDSSFDNSFFDEIKLLIQVEDFRNFIIDVICTGTTFPFRIINLKSGTQLTKKNYNIVGAVNIIVNFQTFKKVCYFDDRFGVNAKYGAGEDGDFFIRGLAYDAFYYNNKLHNYHPSGDSKLEKLSYIKLRKRVLNYGKGVVALLCKHKMYGSATIVTFRAIGGVFKYLLKLKFKIALAYFESFWLRFFYLIKFLTFKFK